MARSFVAVLLVLAPLTALGSVVPYERGADYKYILTERQRNNGMAHYPSVERLRVKLDKMLKGDVIKMSTVGGSIMSGQGGIPVSLPQYIFNFVNDTYPNKIVWHSGAIGGTMSSYMSVCHNMHILKDSDIILVEYSVNDLWLPPGEPMKNPVRSAFERLLRKLLQYPSNPAVILVHSYIWYHRHPEQGTFWGNCERDFSEFERFYHLPAVSIKAAAYHEIAENKKDGFLRDQTVHTDPERLTGRAFYYDELHPSGCTGARMMAELVHHMFNKTIMGLQLQPVTDEERGWAVEPLPPPMIPNNWESVGDKCFIGAQFTSAVTEKNGFEWINESKSSRPKWGMVGTAVGSVLKIQVDTTGSKASTTSEVLIQLAYLRSYEGMGEASIQCTSGCACTESRMQGHQQGRFSQLNLHNFHVSQSPHCIISVTILPATESSGHKVKVAGIMISEEAGSIIRNDGAVEYVHDISMRGKEGVFENRNHA